MSSSRAFPAGDGVESFAFDPIRHRLALTSHHGLIKMYRFENGRAGAMESQMLVDFEQGIQMNYGRKRFKMPYLVQYLLLIKVIMS